MAITQLGPAAGRRGRRGMRRMHDMRRMRRIRCLLAGTALLLAATGTVAAGTTPAVASPVAAAAGKALGPPAMKFVAPCIGKKVTGPFVASGTQVYTNGGKGHKGATVFRSYGPTVAFTLDARKWNPKTQVAGGMDELEMKWAADDWCANTVRLQVNQDLLFTTGGRVDSSYLDAILEEISYAESLKLVVVLNDSTESAVHRKTETMPTLTTFEFWEIMTALYGYGSGPDSGPAHVIFDLFNEPRAADRTWEFWYRGQFGPLPPVAGLQYGMEPLALWVRNNLGAKNLFWIEGPHYSETFNGMYPLYMITVPNVVYAVHHPFAINGKDNTFSWDNAFGYLVEQGIAPVVEGEWTNIGGAGLSTDACWKDAIPQVANYLNAKPTAKVNGYLATHGIGLSAYTMNARRLLRQLYVTNKNGKLKLTTTVNPLEPTVITKATSRAVGWSCKPSAYSKSTGSYGTEGAGLAVYNFFKAENQA